MESEKLRIKHNSPKETWRTRRIVRKLDKAMSKGRKSTRVARNLSLGEIGWLIENGFTVEAVSINYLDIYVEVEPPKKPPITKY